MSLFFLLCEETHCTPLNMQHLCRFKLCLYYHADLDYIFAVVVIAQYELTIYFTITKSILPGSQSWLCIVELLDLAVII